MTFPSSPSHPMECMLLKVFSTTLERGDRYTRPDPRLYTGRMPIL